MATSEMNTPIIVDSNLLMTSSKVISDGTNKFYEALEAIQGIVKNDVLSSYAGDASTAFEEEFGKLKRNCDSYYSLCIDYSKSLTQASAAYDRVETLMSNDAVQLDPSKLFSR